MKIIKIIFINIIIFIFLAGIVELFYYYSYKWAGTEYFDRMIKTIPADKYYSMLYSNKPVKNALVEKFREDKNITSDKKPILFMGCSFTYGDGLDEDETVSAIMAKLTGRPVYNRGGRGWGLSQFYYQSKLSQLYKTVKEPEYIIYTYISQQSGRLDKYKIEPYCVEFQPKYKIVKGKLKEQKPKFFDHLYFIQEYQKKYAYNKIFPHIIKDSEIKLYFTEAEKEFHKHWKDTKMVILLYPEKENEFNSEIWDELKEENYIVIKLEDLVDVDLTKPEYKVKDSFHPNEKAWEIILPKVIKELNI